MKFGNSLNLKPENYRLIFLTFSILDFVSTWILVFEKNDFNFNTFAKNELENAWENVAFDISIISSVRFIMCVLIYLLKRTNHWEVWVSLFSISLVYTAVKAAYLVNWNNHSAAALIICSLCFTLLQIVAFVGLHSVSSKQKHEVLSINVGDGDGSLAEPLINETDNELNAQANFTIQKSADQDGSAVKISTKQIDFKRLFGLARPEWGLLCIATIALFLATLSTMAIPHFIGILIDKVAKEQDRESLNKNCIFLIGIFLLGSIFTFIRASLFNTSGERLVARLRSKLYECIITQETAFFDEQKTGELMNRLSADTTVLQNSVTTNISMGLRSTAQGILSAGLLFVTSWKLALVMLAVVPLLVAFAKIYGGYTQKLSKGYQDALAKAAEVAQEALSNNRTVKSFSAERFELNRYSEQVQASYHIGVKKSIAFAVFIAVISLLSYCSMLTVLWYGGRLVISGEVSTGDLTAFLLYTIYIATALGTLAGLFSDLMSALGASERVFGLIDRVPSVPFEGGVQPRSFQGRIVFEDVQFHYPTRPDTSVLNGITFEIQPNQTVALVGQSGAGKSTILQLMERFYEPVLGKILFDGIELKAIDPAWLHSHVAMVQQEPVLFSGTIAQNITYGATSKAARQVHRHEDPEVPIEEIQRVAKLANCHDFIERFPEGYSTLVGERGVRLSGGQKQRIAIARALLMNPEVLLLDEATSALDAESEHLVQQAIDRLMVARTVVVIAHRLSTVQHADKIIVLSGGRIVSQGRHSELLDTCDIYQQLIKRQLHEWSGVGKQESET